MKNKIDLLSFETTSFSKNDAVLNGHGNIHFITKKIILVMQLKEIFNYFSDIEEIELSIIPNNLEKIKQLYPLPVEIKETEFTTNLNLYLSKKSLLELVSLEKPSIPTHASDINIDINNLQIRSYSNDFKKQMLVAQSVDNQNELIEWNAQTISSIAGDIKGSPISIDDKYKNKYSNKKFQDEIEAQMLGLKNDSFMHFLYNDNNCYPNHYSFIWRREFLVSDIEKFLGISTYSFYEKNIISKSLKTNEAQLEVSHRSTNHSHLNSSLSSFSHSTHHLTNKNQKSHKTLKI